MCETDVKCYFDYALPLVLEAGKVLLEAKDVKIENKNNEIWDLVTIYDRKIEEVLIAKIKDRYPTHKFIGEEESAAKDSISKLSNDPTWIIDPIDGTANFVRKLPITCVSVGLTINREQVMGIVYNPYMDELYTAIRGQGAFLNGERIFTSGSEDLRKSVLCYELSLARRNSYYYNLYMYRLKYLIKEILGIRSLGSAVMGLCYVATGRLDAYQCDGLYPWDAAAATLIVREAGGHVADTTGKEFDLMDPNYIATATKKLGDQYLELEKRADDELLNNVKNKIGFCP